MALQQSASKGCVGAMQGFRLRAMGVVLQLYVLLAKMPLVIGLLNPMDVAQRKAVRRDEC